MILKRAPTTEIDIIDVYGVSGRPSYSPGRRTITNVEIICPDKDDSKAKVWQTLKYGPQPDLAEAMHKHTKIEVIDFPNDGITLYGVTPMSMTRTECWNGRVFECAIDSYVITKDDL